MTPLDALYHAAITAGAHTYHGLGAPRPDICLPVCDACTRAVLTDLARLFPVIVQDDTKPLVGSQVYGCTFRDAPALQCALHASLYEDAPCLSK